MNIKKMSISIIIIMILINITFLPKTLAISDIIEDGDNFLNSADSEEEVVNETKIQEVSSKIYNILLACGIGVAVIVGAGLGIAFILSSAEGKAKISETLVPYIIGCFVVFGAFSIWKIVINIGNGIQENPSTTYTISDDGKHLYCDSCGDELSNIEQHRGKCSNCGAEIEGI